MMKKIKIYFLLFSVVYFSSCSKPLSQTQKIEVRYVNIETFTSISVECEKFEDYFESGVKTQVLDTKQTQIFISEFNSFIKRANKYKVGYPDVRFQAFISNGNKKVITACIGNNLTSFDGIVYINDDRFRDFVQSVEKY